MAGRGLRHAQAERIPERGQLARHHRDGRGGFQAGSGSNCRAAEPFPGGPPPIQAGMANFGFMGVSLTNNNFTDASSFAKKALKFLHVWAAVAQPGASGMEVCGNWNLPQSSNC